MSRSSRVCLAPCPMGGQRTTAPTPPASQMLACRACRSPSATSDTSRQAYSPGLRPSLGRPSVATGYQALHVSVLVPSFSPRLVSAEPGAQAAPSASGRPHTSGALRQVVVFIIAVVSVEDMAACSAPLPFFVAGSEVFAIVVLVMLLASASGAGHGHCSFISSAQKRRCMYCIAASACCSLASPV